MYLSNPRIIIEHKIVGVGKYIYDLTFCVIIISRKTLRVARRPQFGHRSGDLVVVLPGAMLSYVWQQLNGL